ncbi:hypothetical protein LUZ60_012585 [Juncus effusus]|nr:hypothetical protein LUZ60_012585 [Juncus effusus]
MATSSTPSLRIIESTTIGFPPGSTPSLTSIPLTYFDIIWCHIPPVQRLFFYSFPHPTSYFLSSTLPSLKSSLSLTLTKYFPLAGVIKPISGTDKETKHEIYCMQNDSVNLTVAESHDDFQHLSRQHARLVSHLKPLVPCLMKCDESKQLFAVQITVFPDQGVVIGTAVDHMACDGTSSMQFVQSWAATCHSGLDSSSLGPVINRSLLPDPSDLYSFLSNLGPKEPPCKEKSQAPPMEPDVVLASFTLTPDHIQALKRLILCEAKERSTSFHCSTLVVAFAYAWISRVKAHGFESNNKHSLLIPANFRARFQPPLPPTYFGNCVGACIAQIEFDDLASQNGLFLTAEAIGRSIEGLSVGKLRENWIKTVELLGNPCMLTAAGSPKFKVYDVDFGWGKPVLVNILPASKSGVIAVADSKDVQGGVEIGIVLPWHAMVCFEKYFVSGLEILHL